MKHVFSLPKCPGTLLPGRGQRTRARGGAKREPCAAILWRGSHSRSALPHNAACRPGSGKAHTLQLSNANDSHYEWTCGECKDMWLGRLSHTPHKPLTADARHSAARHDRESNGDADLTLAADRTIDADVLAMSKSLAHWTTPQKRAPECRVVKCIKAFLFFLQIVVRCGTPRAVPTRTVVPATTMLFSFV